MKLSFFGAAQNVTGSRFLLEVDHTRVLVDCGLFQERDLRKRNWDPFPVPARSIDAVLLTHAHLDHCGLLPKLVREGFRGRIHCTEPSAEIARIILRDSAHIQEEDAAYKARRHAREGRKGRYPDQPLYTSEDAEACDPLFEPTGFGRSVRVAEGVTASFHNSGHILGASSIQVDVSRNGESRTIVFSGDLGRWDLPIIEDPELLEQADYVVVESTYGDRSHEDPHDAKAELARAINEAHDAGGNVIIPSFALERTQEVLYHLNELLVEDRIPHVMVFVDSPMAINVTEVFRDHPELYDAEMKEHMANGQNPFRFPGLHMTRTVDESKAINHIRGTALIIAGSGMCTGGRVKHHLVNNIERPESSVLFVGYQARGTLGRQIVDGAEEVRIHGQMRQVNATIRRIHGFSAHADRGDLLRWLGALRRPPRRAFVVHGEPESAQAFADHLRTDLGWNVTVPAYTDEFTLE